MIPFPRILYKTYLTSPSGQPVWELAVQALPDKGRKFQSSWMSKYSWINYSDSEVVCQVCQKCDQLGLFTFTNQRDEAFTNIGYDNWKHALAKCSTHESSKSHKEAVLKVYDAVRGINIAIASYLIHICVNDI